MRHIIQPQPPEGIDLMMFPDCPYGKPGDRLCLEPEGVLRSPSQRPHWSSSIILEITGIRVERLQDISPKDAFAEGVIENNDYPLAVNLFHAVDAFQSVWNSINGAGSWDVNPWVWVIEFKGGI